LQGRELAESQRRLVRLLGLIIFVVAGTLVRQFQGGLVLRLSL